MSLKKIICLGLFILPLLGMIAILMNYNSPVSSTIVNKDGTVQTVSTINSRNGNGGSSNGNGNGNGNGGNGNGSGNGSSGNGNGNGNGNNGNLDGNGGQADKGVWITRRVGNLSSTYKLNENFQGCSVGKNVTDTLNNGVVASLATIDRIEYLEILLDTHCIDYREADTSGLVFADVSKSDTKTLQIIKTAINLGIARGYDEGSTRVFRPNAKISKIEALAILKSLSGLELKDKTIQNKFDDVEDNWKANVADASYRLGVTPIDTEKNLFFPEYDMKKGDAYDIIGKVARYY